MSGLTLSTAQVIFNAVDTMNLFSYIHACINSSFFV